MTSSPRTVESRVETRPRGIATKPDAPRVKPPAGSEAGKIGTRLGRYVVIDELGRGAMGRVLRAYEPKLQREVALKVLRADVMNTQAQERMLREARIMAQLSHPNVVAVYDVETDPEKGVLLAMELVSGTTLRRWLRKGPEWPDILRVFVAAGRGLAAAHAEGLLHRDFKPSNVLVSEDGRVKVTDFGLAKPARDAFGESSFSPEESFPSDVGQSLTQTGIVMGTPRYMAPEQHHDGDLTPTADQYAFCVALWEALTKEPPFRGPNLARAKLRGPPAWPSVLPVPKVISEALQRGLSVRSDDRFPNMEALLKVLEPDRSARERRQRIVGASVLVAGLAVGVGAWQVSDWLEGRRTEEAIERCRVAGQSIEEVWNDEARDGVRRGLLATDVGYAVSTADNVMPWLNRQAHEWSDARTEACLHTSVREEWTDQTFDRSLWCLDERRLELTSLVTELARADEEVVRRAVRAAARLTPVASCIDEAQLDNGPPPPPQRTRDQFADVRESLSRAHTLTDAGKYTPALALVREARVESEGLDWPALRALALTREADLLDHVGDYPESERVGIEAFVEAMEASAWGVASDAAVQLAVTVGKRQARPEEGRVWVRHAAVAASHAGDPLGLRMAQRDHSLADIEATEGNATVAKELFERSLGTYRRVHGDEHPRLTVGLNALAGVHYKQGEYDTAQALFQQTLAVLEATYGPDHPQVATLFQNLAAIETATGDYAGAKADYERALTITEKALGPEHPQLVTLLGNAAIVERLQGNLTEALSLNERALSIAERALGSSHPQVARTLNNMAAVQQSLGQPDRAKPLLERALAIHEEQHGSSHGSVAPLLNNLGTIYNDEGDRATAARMFERAIAIVEATSGIEHPDLAFSLIGLAEVHITEERYERARTLLERAIAVRGKSLGVDHPKLAHGLVGLGRVALAEGRMADALEHAQRAAKVLESADGLPALKAEADYFLAKVLWMIAAGEGRDRPRAIALAKSAQKHLEGLPAEGEFRRTVREWLRARNAEQ
ncbi:MAG: serine/threonine-protein kinase [Myxococcota bacterium]